MRLTCPVAIAQFYVAQVVAAFMREHPLVRVEIESTDRNVNLIEERIDVALRVLTSGFEDPGLVTRRIASGRMVLVASPAYAEGQTPVVDINADVQTVAALATIGGQREGAEQS